MYGLLIKFGAFIVALLIAFEMGWQIQGWRLDEQAAVLSTEQARAKLAAEVAARKSEQVKQTTMNRIEHDKNVEINAIHAKLDAALSQLHKRKNRPASHFNLPQITRASDKIGTGHELYRQDAEFLIGEAARADEVATELVACTTAYNAVKD
jgi:hypothetical protein